MPFSKSFGTGGIKPENFKHLTCHKKIENADVPNTAYIPVSQHYGTPAEIIVKEGQTVDEGQLIAKAHGHISANVHSSIPGKIISIEEGYVSTGKKCRIVVVSLKGEFKKSGKNYQLVDWRSRSVSTMLETIKSYGIVGLGGLAYPTHYKLTIPKGREIDTLIINGAECEPFLTADHRLMIDKSEDLLEGINIIKEILDIKRACLAVEDNKLDAFKRLKILTSNRDNIRIATVKSKYPQGDEMQLIKALTGRIVPAGKTPLEVGVLVLNTGTAVAIKEAIVNDKPLIERIITISGSGIVEPKNLKVKIGTLVSEVIDECGGLKPGVKKIIIGGPMMGFAQMDINIPVTKLCSAVLAFTDEEFSSFETNGTCINCGRCIKACAYGLIPTILNKNIKYKKYKESIEYGLIHCKECGACSWACPARIPLVQNIKTGKDIASKLRLLPKQVEIYE